MRLRASNVVVERGGRIILAGIDFSVAAGELLLLLGPNGSGKTSLLRMIAGLGEAQAGTIELDGGSADRSIGEQAHFIGHQDGLKPALTVTENLEFWAGFLGGGGVDEAAGAFGLDGLRSLPAGVLSAGQRRRLALSRLFLTRRPLWLLDEPTTGLDTASSATLRGHMTGHLAEGGIIVAATHVELGIAAGRALELGVI